jgi:hypothetical protein
VRGENGNLPASASEVNGTSPRAWGKHTVYLPTDKPRRNIPTCVGKTSPFYHAARDKPEHPHVRGENDIGIHPACSLLGTSPRAWGKHCGFVQAESEQRNIPTCVGKTCVLRIL